MVVDTVQGRGRAKTKKPQCGVRLLTRDECLKLLSKAPEPPRRNRRQIAEARARLMSGGAVIDGEAVVVRQDRTILHGAEKLYASVESGIGYPTVVITDLDEGSLATSGFFARRTRADFLQAEGMPDPSIVASAYNILDLIGRRGIFQVRGVSQMPHEDIRHYQETFGDLAEEVTLCRTIPTRIIPRALAVVCLTLLSQDSHEGAFAFFAEIGKAARGDEEAHPVARLLVSTLIEHQKESEGGLRDRAVIIGYIMEAWAHYIAGASPERFLFEGRRQGRGYQNFPEVVGLDRIEFPKTSKSLLAELTPDERARLNARYEATVRDSAVKISLEWITPAQAADWLTRNTHNRTVRTGYVDRYRRAMRERWEINGKTLKFAGDELKDGQHRLMACVAEDVSFSSFVVRGLDPSAFVLLDQQGKLELRDVLAREGFVNSQALAAALAAMSHFPEISAVPNFTGSNEASVSDLSLDEQRRFIEERHPGLRLSAERFGIKKAYVGLFNLGLVVAMHYVLSHQDQAAADAFFEELRLEPGRGNPDHPAQVLRAVVTRYVLGGRGQPLRPKKQIDLITTAFEAMRAGRRLTQKAVDSVLKG